MTFTEEHIEVLEKYKEHWATLRDAGFIRYLDRPVFNMLQQVYNEAVAPTRFTHWCGECVAEMVRLLYTAYDRWLGASVAKPVEDVQQKTPVKNRRERRAVLGKGQPAAKGDATA